MKLKKYLWPLAACLTLAACGGGGSDNGISVTDPGIISFDAGGATARIDRLDEYVVLVPSSMNNVTIAANNKLSQLGVTGSANTIRLEDNVRVGQLSLGGANNSLTLTSNDTVTQLDVPGTNASINIGPGSNVTRLLVSGANDTITIQSSTAAVPTIQLTGSNIILRVPVGYLSHTTITNTGANNQVFEQ